MLKEGMVRDNVNIVLMSEILKIKKLKFLNKKEKKIEEKF